MVYETRQGYTRMNTFVLFIDGDLQIVPLQDLVADTDFANIVGEVIGDADTDDPLVALKSPYPYLYDIDSRPPARLSEIRRGYLNGN